MKKRVFMIFLIFLPSFILASSYFPQFFHFYNPSLGEWSKYEITDNFGNKGFLTVSVVAKENDDYWIEVESSSNGENGIVAYLVKGDPTDDENVLKIRLKSEDGPIIEIDKATLDKMRKMQKINQSFQSVGPPRGKIQTLPNEKIKVGKKSYNCSRIKLVGEEGRSADIWTNDEVVPFGIVKLISGNESLVLLDSGKDAKMKLSGDVKPLVIEGGN